MRQRDIEAEVTCQKNLSLGISQINFQIKLSITVSISFKYRKTFYACNEMLVFSVLLLFFFCFKNSDETKSGA